MDIGISSDGVGANFAFGPTEFRSRSATSFLTYPNGACVITCLGSEAAVLPEPGVGEPLKPRTTSSESNYYVNSNIALTHSSARQVASAARHSARSSPRVLLSPITQLLSVAYRPGVVGGSPRSDCPGAAAQY